MKNKEYSTKRPYHSKRRRMQADQTRLLILEASGKLFSERGYTGATIDAIAHEAGVAAETVYATFGNKREILSKLIDLSIVGDDRPIPLMQRDGPLSVLHEKNPHRQIEIFSHDIHEIMNRMAPIFEIMRIAAKTEPEIAEMLQQILQSRYHGMEKFIQYLSANITLQEDLTPTETIETVWAITSAELYNLLTVDRGWSGEQYEQWLAKTLKKLLL